MLEYHHNRVRARRTNGVSRHCLLAAIQLSVTSQHNHVAVHGYDAGVMIIFVGCCGYCAAYKKIKNSAALGCNNRINGRYRSIMLAVTLMSAWDWFHFHVKEDIRNTDVTRKDLNQVERFRLPIVSDQASVMKMSGTD
ncbi:hypothetical protein LSAT2_019777 [Lamellibrachia satsuma]|nr:hypothetical protein LSAT2_019777 [Lamellibrachia satsuma]